MSSVLDILGLECLGYISETGAQERFRSKMQLLESRYIGGCVLGHVS